VATGKTQILAGGKLDAAEFPFLFRNRRKFQPGSDHIGEPIITRSHETANLEAWPVNASPTGMVLIW
jgi:hypothetical protein